MAWAAPLQTGASGPVSIQYFPVGPIYEYRWKLLELALAHSAAKETNDPVRLVPYAEDITQNRGMQLLQSGCH
jgi:hypothetical protein